MFKILVLFAFFTFASSQDANCSCGYKFFSTGREIDPRNKEPRYLVSTTKYPKNLPQRRVQNGILNNTWSDYDYDEFPEDYYDEYTNITWPENTVKLEPRISLGGKDQAKPTGVNEFPMMAAIYRGPKTDGGYLIAGGVIISKRNVLTAAHVTHFLALSYTYVVVGEHHRVNDISPDAQELKALNFIEHHLYNATNNDFDIALIEVERDIPFGARVGPVCLPFKFVDKDFTGLYGTYLGWGPEIPSGPPSDVLRKVDVQVISQDQCRKKHPQITPRHLCTYTPGRDACDQDSGGPLLYTDPDTKRLYIIGIISFGRFCVNDNPGVNIRVTTILEWIQNIAPDNYCGQPPHLDFRDLNKTPPGTYPVLAAVVDSRDYTIAAAATILSRDAVITSASAIKKLVDQNHAAMIIFGEDGFDKGVDAYTPAIRGAKYLIHEQYKENNGTYDIGIIQLEKNVRHCGQPTQTNSAQTGRRWMTVPFEERIPPNNWGQPMPPLNTTCKGCLQWYKQHDQCVSTLTDTQICVHDKDKENCDFDRDGSIVLRTRDNGEYDMGLITYGRCGFCISRQFGGENRMWELTAWITQNRPPEYDPPRKEFEHNYQG